MSKELLDSSPHIHKLVPISVVEVAPTHEEQTFDLEELLQNSRTGEVYRIGFQVDPTFGKANYFEVIVIDGEASVIETDGSFENDAESVTHNLYVLNRKGVVNLVPKKSPYSVERRMAVSVQSIIVDGGQYAELLAKKRQVEYARSNFRKGCLAALGGFALATAACGGMAYEALSEDPVEEAQNAD